VIKVQQEEQPGQVAYINQISSVALHTFQLLSYPVSSWITCQYLNSWQCRN